MSCRVCEGAWQQSFLYQWRPYSCWCAGLLLANLSVFKGCELVFDSSDVPEQAILADQQQHHQGSREVRQACCCLFIAASSRSGACNDSVWSSCAPAGSTSVMERCSRSEGCLCPCDKGAYATGLPLYIPL